jgi:glycosyltransferase involved in cell wall biosynthesis
MKVSVIMITYGHAKYIERAIEGILNQEANFNIELIVANDNSPDETDVIIENLIKKHPKKHWVNYIKNKENKGVVPNFIATLQQAKGEYIALCDGDDYWIDPMKLQKQIDFLEKNIDYSICFTDHKILLNNQNIFEFPKLNEKHKSKDTFLRHDIILNNIIPTLTVVYRNRPEILLYLGKDLYPPDWFVYVLNAKYGKIKFLPFVSAVYRKHDGGVCSSSPPILNNKKYLKSIDIFRSQFKDDYSLQFFFMISKVKISFLSLKIRLKYILNKR